MRAWVGAVSLLFCACTQNANRMQKPAPPAVTLYGEGGESVSVDVEVAQTPEQRAQGLMYRQALGERQGMLFLFPSEQPLSFWMKNTLIPLDMIFIRRDLSIAGIIENAEPLTLSPRAVPAPAQYVLEVQGGFAAKHHLQAGGRVKVDNVALDKAL